MQLGFQNGITSVVLRVKLRKLSDGTSYTGLDHTSSGLVIAVIADNESATTAYTVAGSTVETVTTLGTFAAPTATKCRFKAVDATNHPGLYEIQIADARWAVSNARSVNVTVSGVSDLEQVDTVVQLGDAVRGFMSPTALPNAVAGASNGLLISGSNSGTTTFGALTVSGATTLTGAVSLGSTLGVTGTVTFNAFTVTNAFLVSGGATFTNAGGTGFTVSSTGSNGHGLAASGNGSGEGISSTGGATGHGVAFVGGGNGHGLYAIGNGTGDGAHLQGGTGGGDGLNTVGDGAGHGLGASILGTGKPINGDITGNITGNLSGSVGSVSGAVGSVAGAVGSVTGNVGGNVVGSVGSISGVTFPTNFSAFVINGSGHVILQDASLVTAKLGTFALAKTTNITGFNDLSTAQVNAEVDTALADYDGPTNAEMEARTIAAASYATAASIVTVDTVVDSILSMLDDARTEPGQGAPPVNPDLATKIDYLYKAWRNRSTQTSTSYKLYADNATTLDQQATCSDDNTTFERGEVVTGA